MNFSNIKNLTIPEGSVTALSIGGIQLWNANKSVRLTITGSYNAYPTSATATVNGVTYSPQSKTNETLADLTVPTGTVVNCVAQGHSILGNPGWIKLNGEQMDTGNYDHIVKTNTSINLYGTQHMMGNYGASGPAGQITITEEE